MDEKLLIALVAGGSTILGSIIPTVLNFWNNKLQRDFEIKKLLLEKLKAAYFDLLSTLQSMINQPYRQDHFLALQGAGNQVAIYGDRNTFQNYLDYYNALVSAALGQKRPLTLEENKNY